MLHWRGSSMLRLRTGKCKCLNSLRRRTGICHPKVDADDKVRHVLLDSHHLDESVRSDARCLKLSCRSKSVTAFERLGSCKPICTIVCCEFMTGLRPDDYESNHSSKNCDGLLARGRTSRFELWTLAPRDIPKCDEKD